MCYQHITVCFMIMGIVSSNCISFGLPMLTYFPQSLLHGGVKASGRTGGGLWRGSGGMGAEGTGLQCLRRDVAAAGVAEGAE